MQASIDSLLADGFLDEAVVAQTGRVKAAPSDSGARMVLAELLCLTGAFDRAEAQLGLLAQQDVAMPVAVARMRHLVRAAVAREAYFNDGAAPSLIAGPTTLQRHAIDLALALREADAAAVKSALASAEALRPVLAGTADGQAFDDLRDIDDSCAFFLDILTQDGGYLWVEWSEVAGLRFEPPQRPVDLLWRQARLALRDGRVADIAVPAQYVSRDAGPEHRLARRTEWHDLPGGAVRGVGQRCLLVGEDSRDLLEITEIRFT